MHGLRQHAGDGAQAGHCQLSLYLLHVGRDPYWRNTPRDNPRALTNPQQALSLNLTYLLTAFAEKDFVAEQQAMSIALHAFHEQPLFHNGGGEEFTISIEADTIDEMSRLWQAIAVPIRLSSVIKVGVVFIRRASRRRPCRRRRGGRTSPSAPIFDPARCRNSSTSQRTSSSSFRRRPSPVKAIAGPSVVTGGDTILVGGSGLDQSSAAEVYLGRLPGGPLWQVTNPWRPAAAFRRTSSC